MTAEEIQKIPTYLTYDDVLLLPNYSDVTPSKVKIESNLTEHIKLTLPVVAAPMDTVCESEMAISMYLAGAYGVIHRNLSIEDQVGELKKVQVADAKCGVAVGIGSDFADRLQALVEAGAEEICIDSAHGHTKHVIDAVKEIRKQYPEIEVMAGNVATYEGARDLFKAGATTVKIGMGPGSICTTRVMSGMGVPQLTAVVEGVRAAKEIKGRIVADGGIKQSGDIVKALAVGANAVMVGSLLAGTDEAPGEIIEKDGKKYKAYRGMGSVAAMKCGSASRYGQDSKESAKKLVPEGVEAMVAYKGSVTDLLYQLLGGIKSGMGYLGAATLVELEQKAKFVRISEAGLLESRPHSVIQT